MTIINSNCDVVFAGTGPVGLFTVIQAKLLDPSIDFALFDRFDESKRKQTLTLHSSSFKNVCDLNRLKQHRPQYVDQIDSFAQLILDIKTNRKIKINELENKLRQIAEDLGIAVHTGYTFHAQEGVQESDQDIMGVEGLKGAFPNAKIIVGSDGAHSKIREAVFQNELKIDEGLQHTIAIRYWISKSSHPLNKTIAYPTKKIVGLTQEHFGEYDEEKDAFPVTVQLFVDPITFNKFKNYRAGNPLTAEDVEAIDHELDEKIRTWLAVRKEQLGDSIIGDIEVYSIKLPIYQSTRAVMEDGDLIFCLVGDSFFGVPFFRSVNNGFLCGSQLSKAIVKTLHPSTKPRSTWQRIREFAITCFMSEQEADEWLASPLKRYEIYGSKLAEREIFWAHLKNLLLNMYQWFLEISAQVPWQVNRWSAYDIQRFNQFNYDSEI